MDKNTAIELMNRLGGQKKPFLFVVDFAMTNSLVFQPHEIPDTVLYDIDGFTNCTSFRNTINPLVFHTFPMTFEKYMEKFSRVAAEIKKGNSYLVNLTCRTPVSTNYSLSEIFHQSKARFKLLFKDEFVVFSPEIFIQIKNGRIYSYPMKGTINAAIEERACRTLYHRRSHPQ
jgi:para-aminobenzoate synthetase component I